MATEKRLIDANALLSAIDAYMLGAYDCKLSEVAEFQGNCRNIKTIYAVEGLYEATEIIEEQPTVDAVEVVRCKDCKSKSDVLDCGNYLCNKKMIGMVRPNDFCSFGERRSND